jgi:hypothetical protein
MSLVAELQKLLPAGNTAKLGSLEYGNQDKRDKFSFELEVYTEDARNGG